MYYCFYDSPIGKLLLIANDKELTNIVFECNIDKWTTKLTDMRMVKSVFKDVETQLTEYFQGSRQHFTIPYALPEANFARSVLQQVTQIPYGATKTYSEIANAVSNPKAQRAVGMTNSRNAIPIIIPCHRVIGKNNKLTGFAGGLDTKYFLIALEDTFAD